MIVILGRCRTGRSRAISVGVLTAVFCAGAPIIASVWGPDAVYWATPARIGEILVGALLAIVVAGRSVGDRYAWLAPISLTGLLVCVVTFPQSSGPAYQGALPLVALASAGLVFGLQSPSPLRSLMSAAPLVWLGNDRAARPDGVHWDQSASTMIAEYFLGDQLLRIALR